LNTFRLQFHDFDMRSISYGIRTFRLIFEFADE
jgi:hypothetical protein